MGTMPITKTTKAKEFLCKGDLKSCLRILKTFRVGINKTDKRSVEIAYECLSGRDSFYRQLGIDVQSEIMKGKDIAMRYFSLQ